NVTLQAATLSSSNRPPTVSLLSPTNNSGFLASSNIFLQASAGDVGGSVSKVEFFQNGIKIGETNASPYTITWTNVPLGTYVLTAKATDNGGLSFTCPPVTVFVSNSGGVLTGSFTDSPSVVNLTVEGKYDWANWGYTDPDKGPPGQRYYNRKRNV